MTAVSWISHTRRVQGSFKQSPSVEGFAGSELFQSFIPDSLLILRRQLTPIKLYWQNKGHLKEGYSFSPVHKVFYEAL